LLSFGAESFVFQFAIQKFTYEVYKTIILLVVLCGCKTWSLTMREECRLSVYENRVLRRIFGSKRDKVTGEWRKLLNDLYSSSNIVCEIKLRRKGWAGHVARLGESRSVYRVLVGKPEGKRPLGRPGIDGRITLSRIFRKWDVGPRTGLMWLRIGKGGNCECGNELHVP